MQSIVTSKTIDWVNQLGEAKFFAGLIEYLKSEQGSKKDYDMLDTVQDWRLGTDI